MKVFTERARAKVNLTLSVRGRRADGYHELESLVAFADVGDTVTLTIGPPAPVTIEGTFAAEIGGPNILDRCLDLAGRMDRRLHLGAVTLEKHLPVAAGIGGGSADAGALLRAIRAANPGAAAVDWLRLAVELGADVPVCLANEPSFMTGIGELIVPVLNLPKLSAVLVNPRVAPPADKTAQVFRKLAAPPLAGDAGAPLKAPEFADQSQLVAYISARGNDLGGPARAVVPAIADVEAALSATAGCLLVRISGAGPTCFSVYRSSEAAQRAAERLRLSHPGWWIVSTELG